MSKQYQAGRKEVRSGAGYIAFFSILLLGMLGPVFALWGTSWWWNVIVAAVALVVAVPLAWITWFLMGEWTLKLEVDSEGLRLRNWRGSRAVRWAEVTAWCAVEVEDRERFGAWTLPRMPIWLSQPLTPFCGRPLGSPLGLALSVLIGAATHVLWDSFSHSNGWATLHWPLLHQHVATLLGMRVRVCHLLWYGSTPVGVFCLAVAGQRWLHAPGSQHIAASRSHFYRNALGWAALSLPISLAHHLLHGMLEQVFILGFLGLLILGFLFWIRRQEKQPA